ncbi:MAG TPA: hypothetical protein PKY96_13290 [Flavobacteriales bacterium]|nr:hypothetical protein [Flavobacteriales bacterium]
MIRKAIALLSLLLPVLLIAQSDTLPPGHAIEGRFDAFTTDELGNVYALQGDELVLFDKKGRSWLRNSLKTFGRISTIDAFYSMKPMVFAREQGQVAVLDNTLAVQGSVINLTRGGYPQAVLACMSVQNGFWLFDQRELALIRVDAQLRPLANTGRLDQLLGFAPEPIAMHEHESRLYLNDPARGIHVFDLFGTYMRTIPLPNARSMQVRDGDLIVLDARGAWRYDMRTLSLTPITVPIALTEARDLRIERGAAHVLLPDRIAVIPLAP